VATVALGLILTSLLRVVVPQAPFIFFYGAVAIAAALGGVWYGLSATVLSIVAVTYFFYGEGRGFQVPTFSDAVTIGAYAVVSVVITLLIEAQRRAKESTDAVVAKLQVNAAELSERTREAELLSNQLEESNVDLTDAIAEATEARRDAERSRDQLLSLLASLPDPTVVLDREWRFVYVNSATTALLRELGLDADNLTGRIVSEAIPGILDSPVYPALRRSNIERSEETIEFHLDALGRWYETRVLPSGDGIVTIARDITEPHRHEAELKLLDETNSVLAASLDYEATVERVARMVSSKFADWCFVDLVMDGEVRQLAVAHADPELARWAREFRGRARPRADAPGGVREVIDTGKPRLVAHVTEERIRSLAQDEEHLENLRRIGATSVVIVPLSARGRSIGAMSMLRTGTRRHFDERDMNLANELARRVAASIDNAQLYAAALAASEAKSNFLATVSHELRTPLTAIIGYEELLAEGITGPVNAQQGQQLQRIRASASHLLSLIDEILTYARLEAGREMVKWEETPIKPVVDDAVAFTAPMAAGKGIELRVSPPAGNGRGTMRTDPSKLRQILLNLLSNAVKFTERGTVSLDAKIGENDVVFEVTDTGIGIEKQYLDHIFDSFWQVQQHTTRSAGGSGLGLSVTKRLVDLLGGEITVKSEPQVGTTFRLSFPRGADGATD
jgi:PAS domain S-box-containing protein